MTQPTPTSSTYGPWAWLGSRETSAYKDFLAACTAIGVRVAAVGEEASVCVVDMLETQSLDVRAGGPDDSPPRLFLFDSFEGRSLAEQRALKWDDVEASTTPSQFIVARLIRMEQRHRLVRTAEHHLHRDALTGLLNRRRLERDASETLQGGGPRRATIFLLDLDHFKNVNDVLGHSVGDALLKRLADLLAGALSKIAQAYRIGGDEFAWIALDLDETGAQALAHRVLDAVRDAPLLPNHAFTASIGYAQGAASQDLKAVMENADRALYAAKAAGRDRALSFAELAENAGAQDTDVQLVHFENVARVVTERTTKLLTNFGRGLVQQAQLAADEDKLTRVWNRRYMDRRLGREFELAKANGAPLSIALFDLDHFGTFNKTHGMSTADMVLADFAQLAASFVRSTDWFARYGGEEFVLVVRGPLDDAVAVAERVRSAQAATTTGDARKRPSTTVSIGVAQADAHATSPADVLQRCSQLLQLAKQLGRNRVVASEEAHAYAQGAGSTPAAS